MSNDSVFSGKTGPQGPEGPQGIQGAQGIAGQDGADGQGVPVGGTAGQHLTKINSTDFNTQWTDVPDGNSSIDFIFNDNGDSPFSIFGNSNNYVTQGNFIFDGSTNRGTPTSIKFFGTCSNGSKTSDMRIRDITNNATICELLNTIGNNGVVAAIWDLGALSNISTGQAVWEIQVRKSASDGDKCNAYSLHVNF